MGAQSCSGWKVTPLIMIGLVMLWGASAAGLRESSADLTQEYRKGRQLLEEASGCVWTGSTCTPSGKFYASHGAFSDFNPSLEALNKCISFREASECPAEGPESDCRLLRMTNLQLLCISQESQMRPETAEDLLSLINQHESVSNFRRACPLGESLADEGSRECQDGWNTLVLATGCTKCTEDDKFFKSDLKLRCQQYRSDAACEGSAATESVQNAICRRGTCSGLPRFQPPSSDDSGISTGAVAGIAVAAIVCTIALAAAVAWLILRSPNARNSKKRALPAGVAPGAPGDPAMYGYGGPYAGAPADGAGAHAAYHHSAPGGQQYGAQPPPAGHPATHQAQGHAGPPQGPLFVPPDVYPSAQQFMSSEHVVPTPAAAPHGAGHAAPQPPALPLGSLPPTAASPAKESAAHGMQDVARLPARDVVIVQTARLNTLEPGAAPRQMFEVATRAAWDATAAGTMPSAVPTGGKPEEVLEAQLDHIVHHCQGELLDDVRCGAWVITGLQHRISARSAVVYVHGKTDAYQIRAVKFYFDKSDFGQELSAVHAMELRELMPPVTRIEEAPSCAAFATLPHPLNAHPLPPLIMTEKGEALEDHVARTQPNFVTALSIMIQVAQVIEKLHASGWVHRDLKPTNVIFLSAQARWGLLDWACASKSGREADISFSLYYAAPELVQAYKAGNDQIEAQPSADVWSLGVMAWEIFTGSKFYGPAPDFSYVVTILMGEAALPSEQPMTTELKKKLGNSVFRSTFLSMLHRDPSKRPTVGQLLHSWESVFSQTQAM